MAKFNDTLLTMVEGDVKAGLIPMLLGEPGIGKSSWVEGLAHRLSTRLFTLACNQLADKADLTGARLVPIDGTSDYKQVFYPHSVISDAIDYAEANPRETPILFMDELNRTTPDVTSACLSIPTMRRIGDKYLPKNLVVICAGNDKGNITSLDEASISRFVLYHVAPDVDTYLKLDENLNPFVVKVLNEHPDVLFCKKIRASVGTYVDDEGEEHEDDDIDIDDIIDTGEEMSQITTPRTITGISNWLNQFDNDDLISMLTDTRMVDGEEISALQEAIEGHVGATRFCAFLLEAISTGLASTQNQANTVHVVKPAIYDEMKKCTSIDELDSFVSNLNETEKSNSLLYALYERADNSLFIQRLAMSFDNMTTEDTKDLCRLVGNDDIDRGNKNALIETKTTLASNLSAILEL